MEGAELEHHTPKAVPQMLHDSPLAQLGVGKAGKLGALVLRLEQDKSNGKTSVKDQSPCSFLPSVPFTLKRRCKHGVYVYHVALWRDIAR